ncbi:Predicted oxidoreductase [Actinobaculum suis]|uniref:Aldo/keto reductase n=1 Tax=Actinobaculum suis TaxID=1657 RepID=A0A0K9ES17_9ACTO|nr:aldo/keto reductase [Actinobaculum suis]KMY22666.1 aldo/keto reductase [Actinobaculum suis]MDY5153059.1 aldo/keto reductase [Actinobaculum suis]OCA93723.1 aldo/keto reductase [Actinobaculum suis]OCA94016.1 aldo/keto reductase [Actinobaculum suis]SDE31052.1 Predicted oxidoreductase [Actinobaculum suis]
MELRYVGNSGLAVSSIGLGTLTWGRDTDAAEARGQLFAFLDAGGSLIDVSPGFGAGAAEELLGQLLTSEVSRDQLVICGRAGFVTRGDRQIYGAGRGPLYESTARTLCRLGTDYLDVLIVGGPDPATTDAETAGALATLVENGMVRYIGLSGYPAWRAATIATILEQQRLPLLSVVQDEYSLLHRDPEIDTFAMTNGLGLGFFATSALGRGVLTGKYRHSIPPTSRAASEHLAAFVDPYLDERCRRIVEALARAADGLGRTTTDVALGWALAKPISAAIIGARTASQLIATLNAVDELPDIVIDALDDVS